MSVLVQADYLVVGAGAAGMAFVDALIHNADVRVAMLDRRHSAGGHWLDAYPFVRLHQASEFYGVVSTPWAKVSDKPTARKRACTSGPPDVEERLRDGKVTWWIRFFDYLWGRRAG